MRHLQKRFITASLLFIALAFPGYDAAVNAAVGPSVATAGSNRNASQDGLTKKFSHPDRIRYDGQCLTIEGQDTMVFSAAFHYFRCPQELWRDRFRKIKEAGFNTVETYIPWNWHERNLPAGLDDFSQCDFTDLKAWLHMAQDEFGLYTIVRPGPFICAEWAGGAYPRWLAKFCPEKYDASFWLRSDDPGHIKWSQHWYRAVCRAIADEQITRKPAGAKGIILFQLENEYVYFDMSSAGKIRVLKALYETAVTNGINVPFFTCVTPEVRGSRDPEIRQVFDCDNQYVWWKVPEIPDRIASLKRKQPDAPAFVTELQGGWFSTVGGNLSEDSYLDGRHAQAMALVNLLAGSTGLNYYMFFGGTHFAGWGARRMTTSYDYGAAIKEDGGVGEKFLAVKGVGEFLKTHGPRLARATAVKCELAGAPDKLVAGLRRAGDGTRFVFLFNPDRKQPLAGTVRLTLPDNSAPLNVAFDLGAFDSRVLVLPAGVDDPAHGEWWPKVQPDIARPVKLPAPVRLASALKRNEDFTADWLPLGQNISLPELGVNDCRFSLYRSRFTLAPDEATKLGSVRFDLFTGDPVFIQVNGRIAPRASKNELENVFTAGGLFRAGQNEIIVLYENQGHAHGYKPMEELSGLRAGGLGTSQGSIMPVESWEVRRAASDQAKDVAAALQQSAGWEKIELDADTIAGLATLQIAGLAKPKWPAAWILQGVSGTAVYRTDMELTPEMIAAGQTVIEFGCVDDRGVLFVNGQRIASHDKWDEPFVVDIGKFVRPGTNLIAIAVANASGAGGLTKGVRLMKRGQIEKPLTWEVARDLAGVSRAWTAPDFDAKDWTLVPLATTGAVPRKGGANVVPRGEPDGLLTWYRMEFELPAPEKNIWVPWRLLLNASGNGYLWLNGHNLGRHWEAGPQREFFLPECWLNFGPGKKNVLALGLRQTANGARLNAAEISPYPDDAESRP